RTSRLWVSGSLSLKDRKFGPRAPETRVPAGGVGMMPAYVAAGTCEGLPFQARTVASVRAVPKLGGLPGRSSHRSEEARVVDVNVLRQAPLFSELDDEAASALSAAMTETKLRRGQVLF